MKPNREQQLKEEIKKLDSCWLNNHPFSNPKLAELKAELKGYQQAKEEIKNIIISYKAEVSLNYEYKKELNHILFKILEEIN